MRRSARQEHTVENKQVKDIEHGGKPSVSKITKKYASIEKNLLTLSILLSVSLDPLFFYIPVVNNDSYCLRSDNNLRIIIVVFRTFIDGVCIILLWHQRHELASTGENRRQELASTERKRRHEQNRRVLSGIAAIILAMLPLPQVVVYASSWRLLTVKLIKFIVLIQYVPRVFVIFQTYKYARKHPHGRINMWLAAAFYLLLFTLASNGLGAFWYLRVIERNMDCWKKACKTRGLCGVSSFYCDGNLSNNRYLDEFCPIPPASNSTFFDHGIYHDAFERDIMGIHTKFLNKFFYCFWWGLQSLSSLGQNLKPGTYIWDNFFAIFIVISGLVLLALLIGNMQVYLQKEAASDVESEKQKQERIKRQKSELGRWDVFIKLPEHLRDKIFECEDDNWLRTTEINLKTLLGNTPVDLQREIRAVLCKHLFSEVKEFRDLHPEVQKGLRKRAKPAVFQARSIICKEGRPVWEMIHIVEGNALAFRRESNKKEEFPLSADILKGKQYIGKALLNYTLDPSKKNPPLATETVQARTKVEAFTLSPEDFVAVFTEHGDLVKSYGYYWAIKKVKFALMARQLQLLQLEEQPQNDENENDKL